jgi:hypothetical protein
MTTEYRASNKGQKYNVDRPPAYFCVQAAAYSMAPLFLCQDTRYALLSICRKLGNIFYVRNPLLIQKALLWNPAPSCLRVMSILPSVPVGSLCVA